MGDTGGMAESGLFMGHYVLVCQCVYMVGLYIY